MTVQHKIGGTPRTRATAATPRNPERELAHKLGNLLQVVNGNLELLATRLEDEQLRGYVRNARAAADQLTRIARELVEPVDEDAG